MIDSMSNAAEVLTGKHPKALIEFYEELQLNIVYDNEKRPSM
jgi:hypothetical protein